MCLYGIFQSVAFFPFFLVDHQGENPPGSIYKIKVLPVMSGGEKACAFRPTLPKKNILAKTVPPYMPGVPV